MDEEKKYRLKTTFRLIDTYLSWGDVQANLE